MARSFSKINLWDWQSRTMRIPGCVSLAEILTSHLESREKP